MFLVLHHTIDHKVLKDAMMIHACSVMADKSFEDFIENMVDVSGIDEQDPLAFSYKLLYSPMTSYLQCLLNMSSRVKKN